MNPISAADRSALDASLGTVDIPAVFAVLQGYPDLRHADLPSVEKTTLKAISVQPEAVRQMVCGLATPSPSIRRFCKKYVTKLGMAAAVDLLYLLIESLDPLRPVTSNDEGLLGNCGGYASPLGQSIREANLSTSIRRPEIEVYSEASRFTREVLESLPAALAATDFALFLVAFEFYYGIGIFYSLTPEYQTPVFRHSPELLAGVSYHLPGKFKEVLQSRAKKGDAHLFAAMQGWIQSQNFWDQASWQGQSLAPVRARFLEIFCPEVVSLNLRGAVADSFADSPQAQRVALYRLILAALPQLSEREAKMLRSYSLRYYKERFPEEAQQAEQTSPAEVTASPNPVTLEAAQADSVILKSSPSFKVDREDALEALLAIAHLMELHGVAKAIHKLDLKEMWEEDFPPPSSDPAMQQDEQLLQEIRQLIKAQKRKVSIAVIAETDYGEKFLDLLQRGATRVAAEDQAARERGDHKSQESQQRLFGRANGLMRAALIGLSDLFFEQWLQVWRDRIAPLRPYVEYGLTQHDSLPQLMNARFPDEATFWLLELQPEARWPNADADWQLRLAQVYGRGDERGRQTLRQHLAAALLEPNPHYRRSDWHSPFCWLINQFWQQQESELLGIACDRCAIPMYWKGENAFSPVVKNYSDDRGYAARTVESSDGAIPVQDICKLVCEQQPELLLGIVQHNLQLAGDERAACTLLTCFAKISPDLAPFRANISGLLELLESPHNYAIAAGLEIFCLRPELAAESVSEVLLACDRGLAATSTSVAKLAVECLGELAIADPSHREQATASLENALYVESKSILAETLKTWKHVLAKVPDLSFPRAAISRLQALEAEDPKRYGKLVQFILKSGEKR
jgi:hypothetical protein